MNKTTISNALLTELNRLGRAVVVRTEDQLNPAQVVSISGASGAMFLRTAAGRVLTSAEVYELSFEEIAS